MSNPTALYIDAGIQASKIFDYFITIEAELRFEHNTTLVKVNRVVCYIWTSIQRLAFTAYSAEGLLITRIYASWTSKRLLIFLLVFPAVCFVVSYIISDTSLVFNSTPSNIPHPGDCLFLGGRNNVFEYAALLLYELDSNGMGVPPDRFKKRFSTTRSLGPETMRSLLNADYMGFYHRFRASLSDPLQPTSK
ncbi:hypothetical protein BDR05DRAFT_952296 [Suillus weaverae]|nr:hypothetical protein BDR05DRAFT_952296 [Suillus weaverae]